MKKKLFTALLLSITTSALADNVIITQTQGWKSVPITIDTQANTYTVQGTVPEGNYYYTYSGYRCLREKTDIEGITAITYHAGTPGGNDIYCYAE